MVIYQWCQLLAFFIPLHWNKMPASSSHKLKSSLSPSYYYFGSTVTHCFIIFLDANIQPSSPSHVLGCNVGTILAAYCCCRLNKWWQIWWMVMLTNTIITTIHLTNTIATINSTFSYNPVASSGRSFSSNFPALSNKEAAASGLFTLKMIIFMNGIFHLHPPPPHHDQVIIQVLF